MAIQNTIPEQSAQKFIIILDLFIWHKLLCFIVLKGKKKITKNGPNIDFDAK